MLVLARRQGEEIRISDDITVKIVRLEGRRVRIGIDAPADMHIYRTSVPVGNTASRSGTAAESAHVVPRG